MMEEQAGLMIDVESDEEVCRYLFIFAFIYFDVYFICFVVYQKDL